ncbi:MAG TPA: EAL domain-containing protein [Mycobacteriales bacterium]|nr:EAL domain-containing protein [Mycobacteriales bacterium]
MTPVDVPGRRARIDTVLDIVRDHLGMDIAWISEFADGHQVLLATRGELGDTGLGVGSREPLDSAYCSQVLGGLLPPAIPDTRNDPRTRDLPTTTRLQIGSYVGAPLRDRDGSPVGMLCALSTGPKPGLDAGEGRFLQLLAGLLGTDIVRWMAVDGPARERTRARIQRMISTRALDTVFQPVLDLRTGRLSGYEALSRFDPEYGTPGRLFTEAAEVDLGVELELLAVERAFEHAGELPPDCWLSINLAPASVLSPAARDLLLAAPCPRLVVELTEHIEIPDYAPLLERLDELRRHGIRIAVDDAGAGYASLRHILQLRPDVIKIDIAITQNVHADPVRQALTHSLVSFADSIGATLLAEGVEQQAELDTLARIGVELAQGYLIAKPGTLPGPVSFPAVGRLGRRPDIAAVLGRVAGAVSGAVDEESLVRPLLEVAAEVTGMDSTYLAAVDVDAGTIEVRYARNTGRLDVPEGLVRPWEGSLCHRCQVRGTLWSADVPAELGESPLSAAMGLRTFFSVPIISRGGRLVGSLAGAAPDTRFLGESDLLTLRMLAYLIGPGARLLRRSVPLDALLTTGGSGVIPV